MNISNIKLGHSTNSSSTHSIVFFNAKHDGRDNCNNDGFGWDFFTLKSKETKDKYFISLLFSNLEELVGFDEAKTILGSLTASEHSGQSIDHQSITALPLTFDGKFLDLEFVREFREYLQKDNVAVLGGNDNTDTEHSLKELSRSHGVNEVTRDTTEHMRCRKDKDYWILFNDYTGAKIRFSFKTENEYLRSSSPELIDIKITDKCKYECGYCYQGSIQNGGHGNYEFLHSLVSCLEDMKVFEVAIGGGEPTEYPELIALLGKLKDAKINSNITTRNLQWINENSDLITKRLINGVGFSVDSAKDVDRLAELIEGNASLSPTRFTVQFVMGNGNCKNTLLSIAEKCLTNGFTLLLLGMKNKGRAVKKKPDNYSQWLKWFDGYLMPRLSIDTKMVQDSSIEELEKINDLYITKQDGMFSCYIDAVNGYIAPSSYCNESDTVKLDMKSIELNEEIREAYGSF